jgi:quercetin dioxygenase-like cupin family protein
LAREAVVRQETVGGASFASAGSPAGKVGKIQEMRILPFDAAVTASIGRRPYAVDLAGSVALADGAGEAHVYAVYFEAGGVIGPHEAAFGQLLVPLSGSGWVAGDDDERVPLGEGEAAFIAPGEVHSKGSETGLAALMVQVRDLTALPHGDGRPELG